jgi:hypothetical protein
MHDQKAKNVQFVFEFLGNRWNKTLSAQQGLNGPQIPIVLLKEGTSQTKLETQREIILQQQKP